MLIFIGVPVAMLAILALGIRLLLRKPAPIVEDPIDDEWWQAIK